MDNYDSPFARAGDAEAIKARRNGSGGGDFGNPRPRHTSTSARAAAAAAAAQSSDDGVDEREEEQEGTDEDEPPRSRKKARVSSPAVAATPSVAAAVLAPGARPVVAFAGVENTSAYTATLTKLDCQVASDLFEAPFSHLVVGDGLDLRSVQVALGMALGAWIVSTDWADECASKRALVSEVKFELPLASKARKHYTPLLQGMRVRIVGNTDPSPAQLTRVIEAAGGRVVSLPKHSALCIASAPIIRAKRGLQAKIIVSEAAFLEGIFSGVIPPLWVLAGRR